MDRSRKPSRRIRVTEGSCWPCRDRRVKCDTQKPQCSRCAADKNDECHYSKVRLRWDNQAFSKGQLASSSSLASPLPARALSPRNAANSWHLMYFVAEILPRFSLSETPTVADLDALCQDPTLAKTLHSIAHSHLLFRNCSTSTDTIQENIQARTNAIQTFRRQLQQNPHETCGNFRASVLLCMLDGMLEPQIDCAATKIHYQGGKAIINQKDSLKLLKSYNQGLTSLLLTVFSAMDLTHSILSGASPIFSPEFWRSLTGFDAWWTGLEDDRGFLELMALLAQIAQLGHEVCRDGTLPAMKVVLALQLAIERTKTIPRQDDSLNNESLAGNGTGLGDACKAPDVEEAAFCAAYRSAASIYLYRALCGLHITDDLVQKSVEEGMKAICYTCFTGKHPHCLLFPILIVGSHSLDAEGRSSILQALNQPLRYLGFGSVKEQREFLLATWEEQDHTSTWWHQFQSIANKVFIF